MKMPPNDASYTQLIRNGRYLSRRLRRAKCVDLANECDEATASVREAGRAEEDCEDAVQDAMADRDAADDELDLTAKECRHQLAGRGLRAANEAPYTQVFPQGIEYYTEATAAQEVERFSELRARLTEHLPANDGVRKAALPKLERSLESYREAEAALTAARTTQSVAATKRDAAMVVWRQMYVRIYGTLIARFGKLEAERYFPRASRGTARKARSSGKQAPAAPKPVRDVA